MAQYVKFNTTRYVQEDGDKRIYNLKWEIGLFDLFENHTKQFCSLSDDDRLHIKMVPKKTAGIAFIDIHYADKQSSQIISHKLKWQFTNPSNNAYNAIYEYNTSCQFKSWKQFAVVTFQGQVERKTIRFEAIFHVKHLTEVNDANLTTSHLCSNFEVLFNEGLFSDAVMKSNNGTTFKVHKGVLASRSPVLKAHFLHDTTETQTNVIETSFEEEVLKDVLSYIYYDKVHKMNEMPDKLLAAADFYQIPGLKILCEEALHKQLSTENALDTLKLADLYMAENLKELTLQYIKNGRIKQILNTDSWQKLESVNLLKSLFEIINQDAK